MAREVRLVITCDGEPGVDCSEELDESTPQTRFGWRGQPYTRDLCDEHRQKMEMLMDALASLSTAEGKVTKTPKAAKAPTPGKRVGRPRGPMASTVCRYCDEKKSAQSLLAHTQRFHPGLTNAELSEVAEQAEQAKVDFKAGVEQ